MKTSRVLAIAALFGSTTTTVLAAPAASQTSVVRSVPYPAQLDVTTISPHQVEVAEAWADRGGKTVRQSQRSALASRHASVIRREQRS